MPRTFRPCRLALAVGGLLLFVRAASAQSTVYVTGSAFADIKRFDGASGAPYYTGDGFSRGGTGAGGGLRIGTFLHPSWSLELAVDAGARTTARLPQAVRIAIYPPVPYPPMPAFDLSESTRFAAVSTLVGFHPHAHGRMRLGYLAGFSFVKGTYTADYPSYLYYALATSAAQGNSTSVAVAPVPIRTTKNTTTETIYTGAAILGIEAAVDLTKHLSVVPEIRALTFSTASGGSGVVLIRPAVGVRWSF